MTKEEYLALALKKYENLKELDNVDNLYDYEKQFDQIWRELGKEFMDKSLGGSSKDRRKKKKIKTIYGTIQISKDSEVCQRTNGFAISPYLQEKMLYIGQKEVFSDGAETFKTLLQLNVGSSQLQRLCSHYGESDSVNDCLKNPQDITPGIEKATLYVQVDGSNILTDEGWKEVKLGRIFSSSDVRIQTSDYEGVAPRTTILKSDFLSYKGEHKEFTNRFENLLDKHLAQAYKKVVFITDGETWIDNWLEENYSNHTRILDYYHSVKPLKSFADKAIKSDKKRAEWLDKQKELLLAGKAEEIITNVEEIKRLTKTATTLKEALIRYYENNDHRMDYDVYKQNGWYIGSGAIESAHRVVIQKRMKLSGQRWGNNAQPILNLRALHKSNKWDNIVDIIKSSYCSKAA